jgi:hypothetical protein
MCSASRPLKQSIFPASADDARYSFPKTAQSVPIQLGHRQLRKPTAGVAPRQYAQILVGVYCVRLSSLHYRRTADRRLLSSIICFDRARSPTLPSSASLSWDLSMSCPAVSEKQFHQVNSGIHLGLRLARVQAEGQVAQCTFNSLRTPVQPRSAMTAALVLAACFT